MIIHFIVACVCVQQNHGKHYDARLNYLWYLSQIPSEYPHWMEKNNKMQYHSETTLGKMYDRVIQHPLSKEEPYGAEGGKELWGREGILGSEKDKLAEDRLIWAQSSRLGVCLGAWRGGSSAP